MNRYITQQEDLLIIYAYSFNIIRRYLLQIIRQAVDLRVKQLRDGQPHINIAVSVPFTVRVRDHGVRQLALQLVTEDPRYWCV